MWTATERRRSTLSASMGSRAQTAVWEWTGKVHQKARPPDRPHPCAQEPERRPPLVDLPGIRRRHVLHPEKIYEMGYNQEGKLVRKDALPELKGAQFYTLTLYDVDSNGTPEYLGLGKPRMDQTSPIMIWDLAGTPLFRAMRSEGPTITFGSAKTNPDDNAPCDVDEQQAGGHGCR